MTGENWVDAANRLVLRKGLPLTLQGGEPTLHPDFYHIVNAVNKEIKMDLLTNMEFDVDAFISNVPVWRFTRDAPYAAIRVSYHPTQNNIEKLLFKVKRMEAAGFRVGVYSVMVPEKTIQRDILSVRQKCQKLGVDFRTKEFLGEWKGKLYGEYKYPEAVSGPSTFQCQCKTSELLVDPTGSVYRCHADLYNARGSIAHILDHAFDMEAVDRYYDCDAYGTCNPCDVKVKTNRFQIFGHTSVAMRKLSKRA